MRVQLDIHHILQVQLWLSRTGELHDRIVYQIVYLLIILTCFNFAIFVYV